jgi:hypothetical protein
MEQLQTSDQSRGCFWSTQVIAGMFSPCHNNSNTIERTLSKKINVPVMLVYAQNDYSLNPAYGLDSAMNLVGNHIC